MKPADSMSSLQEMPGDSDQALKINSASMSQPLHQSGSLPFPIKSKVRSKDDLTPALPPQMESVRSHTADEVIKLMNRTPLFMTSLETAQDDDDGENVELEAIRALQYEGSRADVALGFKENGNEMVKAKRWKDGKEFYTQALGVLHEKTKAPKPTGDNGKSKHDLPSKTDEVAELQQEKTVEEACYVNRALCNLELQNYRSTTLDCASTLRLNPSNIKAYYRSSQALLALSKIPEALDACTHGLALSPTNPSLTTLLSDIQSRATTLAQLESQRKHQASLAAREKQTLAAALQARGITIRASPSPPILEDATIHLSPDPLSPSSTLVFPLLLLYPLHAQSDFIKSVPETDSLAQHLRYIFPLPWDAAAAEYALGTVDLYVETGKSEEEEEEEGPHHPALIRVGRNVPLLQWLGGGKVVLVDGIVRVSVLLRGKAEAWIAETKKRRGGA